jgi:hypothetical protein
MYTRQSNTIESFHDSRTFLDANVERLPATVRAGIRRKLDDVVVQVTDHVAGQGAHDLAAKGATQKYSALRRTLLRDRMAPIAAVAYGELPHTPELIPLRMPSGRPSAERLAQAATAMAQHAEQFSDVFTAAGLPQDFVAQLTAASDAVLEAFRQRAQILGKRREATKGLSTLLGKGRRAVRTLDRFLTSALADDPALLAGWKSVSRVRRSSRSTRSAPATESPVTPAVPAATAVNA